MQFVTSTTHLNFIKYSAGHKYMYRSKLPNEAIVLSELNLG